MLRRIGATVALLALAFNAGCANDEGTRVEANAEAAEEAASANLTKEQQAYLVERSRYFGHELTDAETADAQAALLTDLDLKTAAEVFESGFVGASAPEGSDSLPEVEVITVTSQEGAFIPPRTPMPRDGGVGPKIAGDTLVLVRVPSTGFENASITSAADAQRLLDLAGTH